MSVNQPSKGPAETRGPRGEYKPRIATLTLGKLKLITKKSVSAHEALKEILAWVERERSEAKLNMDKGRQARIGDLSFPVAQLQSYLMEIERAAREGCEAKEDRSKEENGKDKG